MFSNTKSDSDAARRVMEAIATLTAAIIIAARCANTGEVCDAETFL
jgi:hypothetical protein